MPNWLRGGDLAWVEKTLALLDVTQASLVRQREGKAASHQATSEIDQHLRLIKNHLDIFEARLMTLKHRSPVSAKDVDRAARGVEVGANEHADLQRLTNEAIGVVKAAQQRRSEDQQME